MRKIVFLIISLLLAASAGQAQQIKRQTLASQGKLRAQANYRMSWTAGSCPGCTVLNGGSAGYLRQGFQQPPENSNNPSGCQPLSATFNISPIVTPTCGTKFDLEFTGQSFPDMTISWDFGEGAFPRTSSELNPVGIAYATTGLKYIVLRITIRHPNGTSTCQDSKAKPLNIVQNQIGFSANVTVSNAKCFGDRTGNVAITTSGGSGGIRYNWSNGATTASINNVAAGRYSVTATDGGGCQFMLDTTVKQPTARIGYKDSITVESCAGYLDGSIAVTASGGTKPYKFIWSNGSTLSKIDSLAKGTYRVTITDNNSCRLDTGFVVNRLCDGTRQDSVNKKLYDVITPNGDGKNDTWVVDGLNKYPDHGLYIYNRWGQLIYNTVKYANTWYGVDNKGEELPSAAYFYVIQLNDDKQTVWSGSITVIR